MGLELEEDAPIFGTWTTIAALGLGVGIASYALRRNQGNQMKKNMLPIPGNNQDTQS
ncbi:hypothetical protein GCM10020331_010700 [Ectobacillus funiculus]